MFDFSKFFNCVFLLIILNFNKLYSQEFACRVTVNTPTNTTSINPKIFKTLEKTMQEFINNRKWTDRSYTQDQKVTCNLIVNIVEVTAQDEYKADITFQSERPVYGSTYVTQMFRHAERGIEFRYVENDPLEYGENVFNTNLASNLAFYCYMMLAWDLESFRLKGGQTMLEKAENVCNVVPPNISGGWQRSEANTIAGQRSKIAQVLTWLNPRYDAFRKAVYDYHINGLDLMESNPKEARKNILAALEKINEVNKSNPHFIINMYILSKQEELIKIFKTEPADIRKKAADAIGSIEPSIIEVINRELK